MCLNLESASKPNRVLTMKNAYSMAMKCNRIIDKSICCSANIISRRLTSARSLQSCTKKASSADAETEKAVKRAASSSPGKANFKPLYLMDENVAKKIAATIIAHHGSKELHVMQMYPGLGLLTKELLQAGMKKIHMYEEIKYFWPALIELQKRYPDRLELHQMDVISVLNMSFKDWKYGSSLLDAHFGHIKKRPWSDGATFAVIGSMATPNFLFRLLRSLLFQNRLRQRGRWILYLCLPPSVSLHLSCTNESYDLYRWIIVMFQTLFRIQILEEIPRSAFHPKFSKLRKTHSNCRRKIQERDSVVLHLVKIEADENLFDSEFTEMDLVPYYYFINHHFKSRHTRIIPALEKWLPGCGSTFIKAGINIYTEFGELRPHEARNLYVKFKSLPDYRASSFVSCVSNFFSDIEEHITLNESSQNIDEIFEASVQEFENQKKKFTK